MLLRTGMIFGTRMRQLWRPGLLRNQIRLSLETVFRMIRISNRFYVIELNARQKNVPMRVTKSLPERQKCPLLNLLSPPVESLFGLGDAEEEAVAVAVGLVVDDADVEVVA